VFILIYLLVALMLFVASLIIFGSFRTKGQIARALNMSLFLITLPREELTVSGQSQKTERDFISIMEQFYSSISNLNSKGWNKFLYGEPYIVLEMAVHHIGEDIFFYIAVPKFYEQVFEKQIHGFFPKAEVEKVKDYNIFNPTGVSKGAYLKLKNNPILPFKTYQQLPADPLTNIANALSKLLEEGEGAAIQILIRPSHEDKLRKIAEKTVREMQMGYNFSEAYLRAKHPPRKSSEEKQPERPKTVTPFDEEIIKAIQSKASKPLFDTNIRLIVSSQTEGRSSQILDNISAAFAQFSSSNINSLNVVKPYSSALNKLLFDFSFRLFRDNQKLVLSSEELASLYHFPFPFNLAPKIKFLKSKSAEPPSNLPKEGIILGENIFRSTRTLVRMAEADRRRHLYIIGQTGTGKTVFMQSLIRQDIENGNGVCVIDPHGEFAEFVLSIIPHDRAEDVIYFDPGDISRPMGLNMLEIDPDHPEQKTIVIDALFEIFDKLYDLRQTGGPMFEKYFKNSALLLLDDYRNDVPVLADISRVLVDEEYRADKLSRETNPLVKEFWELEAQKAGGEHNLANIAPYISSKITSFVYNEFLRPIINQKKSAFNFREVMDNQKILVVNLSKGKIGSLNADLLGMIMVGKLLMAALSRVDIPDNQRKDFYFYIDEFQNFTTDGISVILSEARKYRLNLIIAHQFIKQLKDKIRDAVFGNVGSIVSFRIGPDDAEFMKNKFEPIFTPQDLMNIDNLNAYVSLLINGQTSRPFNIRIYTDLVFNQGNRESARVISQLSKLKYGRPREEVEKEIREKFKRFQ
jgi:hypothetical protein